MWTETLASCAETRQTGAATTSAANKARFIMRQFRAPLTRSPKIRCLVGPPIGLLHRAVPLPIDAGTEAAHRFDQCVVSTASRRIGPQRDAADCGWKRPFDDPIALPHGRQFVTSKTPPITS